MVQAILNPYMVRAVQVAFTSLALGGIIVCVITTIDAQRDLRAMARAKANGSLRMTGLVARRGAIAAGFLHLGFFLVGLTAILGRLPPPSQYPRSVLLGGAFLFMQGAVVVAQAINQLERARLREGAGEECRPMSWYLNIPMTPREEFESVVDAAEATGQDPTLPGVAEDVAAAKAALKLLGARIKRPVIGGYANGHALQADEGPEWSDSIGLAVNGFGPEPGP